MSDKQPDESKKPTEGESDPSFNPTKVQDLAKAGREDVDPNEGQE